MGQESAFNDAQLTADDQLGKEDKNETAALDHLTSLNEDSSMKALENWLKNMTSSDRHIMKKLARNAGNEIEKELHYAGARRMAREEAGWYACAYILANPDDNLCQDFHENTLGRRRRGILRRRSTRGCATWSSRSSTDLHPCP